MQEKIDDKKRFFVKIILIIVFIIITGISFMKNKIEENSYNKMYENIQIENLFEGNEVAENTMKTVEENSKLKVYITGAVKNPGIVELEEGARIQDAINLAGGAREDANLEEVNLAYRLEDGQKIYIPKVNDNEVEYVTTESGSNVIEETQNSDNMKVNINVGGIEELKNLPGVGDSLAQKIIDYREENGKFKTVEDLKNVSGIGDKKFESMKEYVRVK